MNMAYFKKVKENGGCVQYSISFSKSKFQMAYKKEDGKNNVEYYN